MSTYFQSDSDHSEAQAHALANFINAARDRVMSDPDARARLQAGDIFEDGTPRTTQEAMRQQAEHDQANALTIICDNCGTVRGQTQDDYLVHYCTDCGALCTLETGHGEDCACFYCSP